MMIDEAMRWQLAAQLLARQSRATEAFPGPPPGGQKRDKAKAKAQRRARRLNRRRR